MVRMQLSDEEVKEYIELYREDFGEELTPVAAREVITRLIVLFELLCKPLPAESPPSAPG